MAWWGKIVGGACGLLLGGPLGALLGAALGHGFDKGLKQQDRLAFAGDEAARERVQSAFFTATFSVLGHIAKADGRVTPDEIRAAQRLMSELALNAQQRQAAIALFRRGKAADFPLDEVLDQFRAVAGRRRNLLRIFLKMLLHGAYADGQVRPEERRVLEDVCARLSVPLSDLRRMERLIAAQYAAAASMAGRAEPSLQDAYASLGVNAEDDPATIRQAYRRLLNRHHPDKLVAKGLPEEMMALAAQKTHDIKQAYERIRAARGF